MNQAVTPSVSQKLDELFKPWNRSDAPGLVIGVAHKGRVIYRRGFGLASVESGMANTPLTRMRIGSTSKHFACLAALLLAEDGKLDVNAAVRNYLPELSGVSGEPTLRELMNHTSGLRDPFDLPGMLAYKGYSNIIPAGAGLEAGQRFTSSNFARGERMIYCNQGYHLLSLAIERVSGTAYGEFLRQRVLAPLGMNDTCVWPSDMDMLPGIASLHCALPGGQWRRGIYPSEELLGSGGMVSTIDDMLGWIAHLRGVKRIVGSQKAWEQMLERPRYGSGAAGDYCLGLVRETYRGTEIVHHAGAVLGGTCQMLTVPEHELDISLMFNRMDGSPATALKVVDAVLGETLAPAAPVPRTEGRESLLARWYDPQSHRLYALARIAPPGQDAALAMQVHGSPVGLVTEHEGKWIVASSAHGAIAFTLPAEGENPESLEFTDAGHAARHVRLPETGPAAAELAPALLGRYRYADYGEEYTVVLDEGVLYLDLHPASGKARYRLEPYSADVCGMLFVSTAVVVYPSLGSLSIERKDGKVVGLWLNTARTRNLWIERLA